MDQIEYFPIEFLKNKFEWKDKRTAISNLQKLQVPIIYKGGKHWFSVTAFNDVFKVYPKKNVMGYKGKLKSNKIKEIKCV